MILVGCAFFHSSKVFYPLSGNKATVWRLMFRSEKQTVCRLQAVSLCQSSLKQRIQPCRSQDKANWSFWPLWKKYKSALLLVLIYSDWPVWEPDAVIFHSPISLKCPLCFLLVLFFISALHLPFITSIRSQLLEAPSTTKKANLLY